MNKLCGLFVLPTILYGAARGGLNGVCFHNGIPGVVKRVDLCESIPKDVNILKNLAIYGYEGDIPTICCHIGVQDVITGRPVATTPRLKSSTTEYVPEVYDYITTRPDIDACAPLTSIKGVSTLDKTGRKAWDKCLEYQERLIYPCEESVAILGGLTRYNHCRHGPRTSVDGRATRQEYPHMALFFYSVGNGATVRSCSGTLISEKFILTAARCKFGRKRRSSPFVMVGSLNGPQNLDQPQKHRVRRVIRHPQFRPGSRHHDIALVETETTIILDQWTVPACLDVFGGDDTRVVATQWTSGTEEVHTETLKKLHPKACRQHFSLVRRDRRPKRGYNETTQACNECWQHLNLTKKTRRLQRGYNDTIQACYGTNVFADTLQNNQGGPITIMNRRISCMYDVIGITSVQRSRRSFTLGLFSRIAYYVPWIESVVWP